MKALLLLLFSSIGALAQSASYDKIRSSGNFKEYIASDGQNIKVGDTLTIGYPLGKEFTFITQGNQPVAAFMSNRRVVISNFKSVGSTQQGYKIYALFKGYGLIPVYIDYEAAKETGELKTPKLAEK